MTAAKRVLVDPAEPKNGEQQQKEQGAEHDLLYDLECVGELFGDPESLPGLGADMEGIVASLKGLDDTMSAEDPPRIGPSLSRQHVGPTPTTRGCRPRRRRGCRPRRQGRVVPGVSPPQVL